MSGAGATVRCRELTRVYDRGSRRRPGPSVTALDGVSLDVEAGAFLALTGPSGSGKSTLLHLIAALDTPTSGTVRIDGTDVGTLTDRERARLRLDRVGIVFQRFHLLPALSARANVALPLIEKGVPKRRRRERASALLERVGLGDRHSHRPGALSGGEQQRVAIARALVTDPALVVADEPTGELDSATGEAILAILADLAGEHTVIVGSHDAAVPAMADRELTLRDGRLHAGDGHG